MAELLGHLAWWRVGDVSIPHAEAQTLLPAIGFPAPPPSRVLPVDAFRRLANEVTEEYTVGEERFALRLHVVEHPRKDAPMLVRHIVRQNLTLGGYEKVGEAVFYKPPKGQPSKSRMRVNVQSTDMHVEEFGNRLRKAYDTRLDNLDAQGVRRIIRAHLSAVGAVPLAGPYFFHEAAHVVPLAALCEHLGEECVLYQLPVEDTEHSRQMLARGRT